MSHFGDGPVEAPEGAAHQRRHDAAADAAAPLEVTPRTAGPSRQSCFFSATCPPPPPVDSLPPPTEHDIMDGIAPILGISYDMACSADRREGRAAVGVNCQRNAVKEVPCTEKNRFAAPDPALAAGTRHAGFRHARGVAAELSGQAYLMRHDATGARALWLACADTNRSFAISVQDAAGRRHGRLPHPRALGSVRVRGATR